MKVFIGLDLSLTGTGVCIMNEVGKLGLIATFPADKLKGVERLAFLEKRIGDILAPYFQFPCLVAIEGYSFGSFAGRERIGEWGGVMRLSLFKNKPSIPYIEVPPTTLKKWVTGSGIAKKNQMLLAVYKRWGVTCQTDDEADAYSLARFIQTGQTLPVKIKKSKIKNLDNL